jgi:phosphatidate cytidylyltransferase
MGVFLPRYFLLLFLGIVSALLVVRSLGLSRPTLPSYLRYLWAFILILCVSEWFSFTAAIWMLAFFSFLALREYFSLVDIRLHDRWGILGAYVSIPFMTYLIQIHWYGMFIISIPVYTFLVIPLLVALGGVDSKGTVFSIGVIDLGLFLFVYCIGHIAYLAMFSTWMAALLIAGVAWCDLVDRVLVRRASSGIRLFLLRYLIAAPITVAVSVGMAGWMTLPIKHSLALGLLIPLLVLAGSFATAAIESDLGISKDRLLPGTGQIIHGAKSFLFTAPVTFHYIRYFWEEPVFG